MQPTMQAKFIIIHPQDWHQSGRKFALTKRCWELASWNLHQPPKLSAIVELPPLLHFIEEKETKSVPKILHKYLNIKNLKNFNLCDNVCICWKHFQIKSPERWTETLLLLTFQTNFMLQPLSMLDFWWKTRWICDISERTLNYFLLEISRSQSPPCSSVP